MAGLTPYTYRPGNSVMHRLPPPIKLLGLLTFSTAAFFFALPALALASCLFIILSLLAGIKPWELLRGCKPLCIMLLCIFAFRSFGFKEGNGTSLCFKPDGAFEALIFAWSVLLSFAAGAIFFSVTAMTEIRDSLGTRFGTALALMLGFLPRFFDVWETANLAWKARAGKRGLRAMVVLIPLVIERMIETAAETAQALEARAWNR